MSILEALKSAKTKAFNFLTNSVAEEDVEYVDYEDEAATDDDVYGQYEDGNYGGRDPRYDTKYDSKYRRDTEKSREKSIKFGYSASADKAAKAKSNDQNSSNVFDFKSGNAEQPEIIAAMPTNMEQASSICGDFKMGKLIVVNVEGQDVEMAQRIADFLGGAVHVMNGEIQRLSNAIFMMVPAHFKFTQKQESELRNEIKSGSIFARSRAY